MPLLTDILPKTVVGCPCIKHYFPTPNQQPEKTAVFLAPSEERRQFSQATKSIVIKKNPENIRLFSDKGETNEQTNFLDELSVGDQFIDKSQNKNSYSFDFVSSTIITLKGGFSIDRALPLSHAEHCTNLQVGEGF